MNIFEEFPDIVNAIEKENIKYALVGGIAMAFHSEPRFTRDIDILVFPEDLGKIRELLTQHGYIESAAPWTFKKTNMTLYRFIKAEEHEHLQLDILTANEERHMQIVEDALEAESEHGKIRVGTKRDLIWLKQQRGSDQDKVDIKKLQED